MKSTWFFFLTAALAWGQVGWNGGSNSRGSMVTSSGSACGPPSYSCARTDRVLTSLPSVPPQAGPNVCSPGQSLPSCGNVTGFNTTMIDPLYNNVRIVRATDATTDPSCNGPSIGPGGSAEENVFSQDEQ